jgi:dTDP-4-dehydrorhamnose reductase
MFITGGSGLLGRHLQRTPALEDWEMIAPSSTALDVRHRDVVIDSIKGWKPKVVVHLAYRKSDRPSIVAGSRNVAEAAAACGARLIHLSTDVVFPGREAPYKETDSPFPISDYGRMKEQAEQAVAEACPQALILRTSLLYGTDIVAPIQIDVRRALSGVTNMAFYTNEYRCPAHAADVATAIARLAGMRQVTGPLHVAGPRPMSRADLAAVFARWMGLNPLFLRTQALADSGFARPGRVVLDSSKAAGLGITCRPVEVALG